MGAILSESANSPASAYRSVRGVVARVAAAVYVVAIAAMCAYAIIYGPKMREMLDRQKSEQIDQQSRFFCQKFGMDPGTTSFAVCVNDLAEIRRRHEERLNQDLAVFF